MARRHGITSQLERKLENEADSLGCLAASIVLITTGILPWFFIVVGSARYIFLLALGIRKLLGRPFYKLRHSRSGRILAGIMMNYMLLSMLPIFPARIARVLMPIVSIPYLAGFLRDFYSMCSGRYISFTKKSRSLKEKITPEARENIQKFFDELAPTYHPVHGNANKLVENHINLLLRYGDFSEDLSVVDVGCGPGFHLIQLADKIGYGIGTDFSEAMVREAKRRLQVKDAPSNLEFRLDDAIRLDTIADASIDRVISIGLLAHVQDSLEHFRQAARVLKPGGRYI